MHPVRLRLAAALLCSLSVTSAASAAEKLVLGNEGSYPPFSITDASGKLTGVEPELAREMCKRMNVECEIVAMDFKALIPAMLQNKLDAIATQIKPTAERKERALFGMPIVYNPDIFVVKADRPDEITKETVKGLKFGQMRGTVQVKYLTDQFGDAIEIVSYDNPDQIRLDLLNGRIDATLGPRINWSLELLTKPEGKAFKAAGAEVWTGDPSIPVEARGSSWIVRKDSEPLITRMNAALKSMIDDCTFTAIRSKFVAVPIVPGEKACVKS